MKNFSILILNKSKDNFKLFSVSLISQAISSSTNLILTLYLLKVLTPNDFGLFGICFALVLLLSGFSNALFLTPMIINLPDYSGQERLNFLCRTLFSVLFFCIILFCITVVVRVVKIEVIEQYQPILIPTLIASTVFLLKECFIRYAYSNNKEMVVLWMHTATFFALLLSTTLYSKLNWQVNITNAIGIFVFSHFIALLFASKQIKVSLNNVDFKLIYSEFSDSIPHRLWSLSSVITLWLQGQSYMYVTAFKLGPQGVAHANAAKIYISPAQIIMPAINQMVFPKLVNLSADANKLIRGSFMILFILISAALLYSLILIFAFDYISPFITGGKYNNTKMIMYAWCVVLIAQFSASAVNLSFQVNKEFKLVAIVSLFSAFVGLVATVILIRLMGIQGAVFGTAVSSVVMATVLMLISIDRFSKLK